MTIDLTKFTSKNDPRPYCTQPIRLRDGRVAATELPGAVVQERAR